MVTTSPSTIVLVGPEGAAGFTWSPTSPRTTGTARSIASCTWGGIFKRSIIRSHILRRKAVLCITAFRPTRLPQRVTTGGYRIVALASGYVRSTDIITAKSP
jgi:hypothetical protein